MNTTHWLAVIYLAVTIGALFAPNDYLKTVGKHPGYDFSKITSWLLVAGGFTALALAIATLA